jgi:putative AlgH/UPF0301 family transcriptional regulator
MDRKDEAALGKGVMLVAMPTLLDPNFRQTVVLLCEHGAHGATGLVLNRPTTVPLSTIYPEAAERYGREEPVYVGGPVQTNALMILYRGQSIPTAHRVSGGRPSYRRPAPAADTRTPCGIQSGDSILSWIRRLGARPA